MPGGITIIPTVAAGLGGAILGAGRRRRQGGAPSIAQLFNQIDALSSSSQSRPRTRADQAMVLQALAVLQKIMSDKSNSAFQQKLANEQFQFAKDQTSLTNKLLAESRDREKDTQDRLLAERLTASAGNQLTAAAQEAPFRISKALEPQISELKNKAGQAARLATKDVRQLDNIMFRISSGGPIEQKEFDRLTGEIRNLRGKIEGRFKSNANDPFFQNTYAALVQKKLDSARQLVGEKGISVPGVFDTRGEKVDAIISGFGKFDKAVESVGLPTIDPKFATPDEAIKEMVAQVKRNQAINISNKRIEISDILRNRLTDPRGILNKSDEIGNLIRDVVDAESQINPQSEGQPLGLFNTQFFLSTPNLELKAQQAQAQAGPVPIKEVGRSSPKTPLEKMRQESNALFSSAANRFGAAGNAISGGDPGDLGIVGNTFSGLGRGVAGAVAGAVPAASTLTEQLFGSKGRDLLGAMFESLGGTTGISPAALNQHAPNAQLIQKIKQDEIVRKILSNQLPGLNPAPLP